MNKFNMNQLIAMNKLLKLEARKKLDFGKLKETIDLQLRRQTVHQTVEEQRWLIDQQPWNKKKKKKKW